MMRDAIDSDYAAFARLYAELATGDPVPPLETWRSDLAPRTFVIEDGGKVVGYVYFQVLDGLGYIRHVVSDPTHRGRGVGRRLMQETARRMRAAGAERWCLNVKPANRPAVSLYESLGMSRAYSSCALRMDWAILDRLPRAEGVIVRALTLERDAMVESHFDLAPGILADDRTRRDVHLLEALRGERLEGLAVFDTSFPGAFPFKAQSLGVVRGLLEAMRPVADPAREEVSVVLEDQEHLVVELEALGAIRRLELDHYRGQVPIE